MLRVTVKILAEDVENDNTYDWKAKQKIEQSFETTLNEEFSTSTIGRLIGIMGNAFHDAQKALRDKDLIELARPDPLSHDKLMKAYFEHDRPGVSVSSDDVI